MGDCRACSSGFQLDTSFTQWFPGAIRALEAHSQICANPALVGTELEEKGRWSPMSLSVPSTDLVTNAGPVAPG